MSKKLSLVIALVVVLAIALPVIAACDTGKTVDKIEFVNPVRTYNVGDTIDYDSLQVKVTYTDNSSEQKTVADLKKDGATLTAADLSKQGNTSYSLTYKGKTATVRLTVGGGDVSTTTTVNNIMWPEFYANYLTRSAARGAGEPEDEGDFRVSGEVYEVGNVNKFLFGPNAVGFDLENQEEIEIANPKTTVRVYSKDTKEGAYTELTGAELKAFVTVDNNTYKFSEDAADKYVKLEISLDEEFYDVSETLTGATSQTVEFYVVDGGYNVYDQLGLSVMADLEKRAWSEIWECEYHDDDAANHKTTVTPIEDESVKLLADDLYLCQYVDNISWVVLHGDIELDPDQMPSLYFWSETGETSAGLDTAKTSLEGHSEYQNDIVGTMRDGNNSGINTGDAGHINYSRVMDVVSYHSDIADMDLPGDYGIETGIWLNMAKGIFATKKVSVSGNYNSIVYENRDHTQRSPIKNRVLLSYADWGSDSKITDPVSHWSVFQFIQPRVEGADRSVFTLKNLALSGNNPMQNDDAFKAAGLMLSGSYAAQVNYYNFNAKQFFTSIVQDNYGDFAFDENGKFHSGGTSEQAKVLIDNSKLYNNYSNMTFLWRGDMTIKNSEMIGSGGPLFIMCDANHTDHAGKTGATTPDSTDYGTSDEGGPQLKIDTKSKLQAFATGLESWYAIYDATPLFNTIKAQLDEDLMRPQLGKTVTFSNEKGSGYVNVIAVIIPDADMILKGKDYDDNTEKLDVRGVVTQTDDSGEVVNHFAMHNNFVTTARRFASGNATQFPMYLECGDANLIYDANATGLGALWNASTVELEAKYGTFNILSKQTVPAYYAMQAMLNSMITSMYPNAATDKARYQAQATFSRADKDAWTNETSQLVCLYLSAGTIEPHPVNAPYFGILLQIGDYSAT